MADADARRARFEQIFADTYRPVRAYVSRRAPAGAVEDVLSDVFLVAWRRLDAIGDDPLPWLFGVARRVLANQRRAQRRRDALLDRLRPGAGFGDPGWQPPDGLRSELAAAVSALSALEREALLLVAWEGLTPERGALAVGCAPSAFRVRLHRARRRVATSLSQAPALEPGAPITKGAP